MNHIYRAEQTNTHRPLLLLKVALLIQVQNLNLLLGIQRCVWGGAGRSWLGGVWQELATITILGLVTQQGKGTYLLPCDGAPPAPQGTLEAGPPWDPFLLLGFSFFLISLVSWALVA